MSPKVSVVVPVYNLEFYIDRCLRSLENQTLQDIEVLVVNDGGTDDSQLIIDEYVARRPDIFKPHIKTNGGHGAACNYGIDRATGEYIAIVDGDDFLDADSLEFMYEKARVTGADLLIGNLLYCYTGSTAPFKPLPFEGERELGREDRDLLYKNGLRLVAGCTIGPSLPTPMCACWRGDLCRCEFRSQELSGGKENLLCRQGTI